MLKSFLTLFILLVSLAGFSQNGTQPVLVTDLINIKSISGVNLSKDAGKAVFTVTGIEPDGESKLEYIYTTQVWMINTDGQSKPKQLTAKENSSQAVLSPDGSQVAFVRAVDSRPQVFLMSLDGGEARQLTKFKYGAGSPRWSPDGRKLLFASGISLKDLLKDSVLNPGKELPVWSIEKPGFENNVSLKPNSAKPDPDGSPQEVRAYLDANMNDKKAIVINKLNFQDEANINGELSFSKIFIIEIDKPEEPKLLTPGFFRYGSADFTTDGRQIIFSGNMDSTQHPDRVLESEIYIMNADGSGLKKLYGEKGRSFFSPTVSTTGKWIAFQHSTTSFVNIPKLAVAPLTGGPFTEIPFDRNKGNLTWSGDDQYIYFTSPSNGGAPICRADRNSKKVETLTGFDNGTGSFDIRGNKIVFVRTEVANPFELYLSDKDARNARRISNFNAEWIEKKKLSFPEKHEFTNSMGMKVEYWIMKPAGFEQGKKYPLLLEIHGGPSAMWGPGESSMWHEYQYFCSKGYGIVYCNPRGSGGYGQEFLRANINDWGAGPSGDVTRALDLAIAQGWADTSKLFLTGGSYAGYLVAWIIAHDQRFKAACVQRGVYDLATFFGEGNAWRLVPNYFGGFPWDAETKATLQRESPISYVQNIHTPLIIFHGDNDRRTGFVQSEMLYRSLKALGRPVEYVRHPGATHEITRSGNNRQRIDQLLRTWEFFLRFLN